jgi:hypothetical protein
MISAFIAAQFNTIMKWLGFIGIALGVLWSVRKSGRDSEKAVNAQAEMERTEEELNEIKRDFKTINKNAKRTSDDTNDILRKGEF